MSNNVQKGMNEGIFYNVAEPLGFGNLKMHD